MTRKSKQCLPTAALALAAISCIETAHAQRLIRAVEPVDFPAFFGQSTCWLNDVNGDGVADYAIAGGPGPFVRIFSGATGSALVTIPVLAASSTEDKDATLGAAGDIDGDGATDIVHEDRGQPGQGNVMRISSGATGAAIRTVVFPSGFASFRQIDSSQDYDGDGRADQLVSVFVTGDRLDLISGADGSVLASVAPNSAGRGVSISTPSGARAVTTFATPSGARLRRYALIGQVVVELDGLDAFGFAGIRPTSDVDGDGWSDVIVRGAGNFAAVGVFSGRTLDRIWVAEFDHSLSLGVPRVDQAESALDVDGDGVDDVVYTVTRSVPGAVSAALSVEVRSGVDGAPLAKWIDYQALTNFGRSVTGVPDLDGDGKPELLIGQPSGVLSYPAMTVRGRALILGPAASAVGPIGLEYCRIGQSNSTGLESKMMALGTSRASDASIELQVSRLPPGVFGIFLTSRTPSALPVSPLGACLLGSIGRFVGPNQIVRVNALGYTALTVPLNALPQGSALVSVLAGETWAFQFWHRDRTPTGQAMARHSPAITIRFD